MPHVIHGGALIAFLEWGRAPGLFTFHARPLDYPASMIGMPTCPVCAGTDFAILKSAAEIESECNEREAFIQRRLTRRASPEELKDLTDFFRQAKAEIHQCAGCTLLLRREVEKPLTPTYSEDEYDPSIMDRQYPRYVEAFRNKQHPYRGLLPAAAQIIEVGSHYGAFLQTAREWGWHAEGIDVGKDTSRFAREKGFTVHQAELSELQYPAASLDAVFIWNCFEQIEDPAPLLRESRRILKAGGLLVLRTPNGLFYSSVRELLTESTLRSETQSLLIDALGYNNLLGFPYFYGHRSQTLEALAAPFRFRRDGMLNSQLIVFPLPENPAWVAAEERTVNSEVQMRANSVLARDGEALLGPWIEVWFRAC